MKAKEFRLDFYIAIAALLVSVLTSATLLYQTRVISDQYASTIWPYLTVDSTFNQTGLSLSVTNEGVGPALIQSAQLVVDGTPVSGWQDYFARLFRDPTLHAYFVQLSAQVRAGKHPGSITTANLAPTQAIRPGDTRVILNINLQGIPLGSLASHHLDLNLCYCSLNQSCWALKTSNGKHASPPQSVAACPTSTEVEAPQNMFPAQPRHTH